MTRAASLLAVVLALLLAISPWAASTSTLSVPAALLAAVLLLAGGHGAFRGKAPLHVLFLAVSMAVLARFLPAFFMETRFWPDLAIILVSAIAFGLGLLGLIMDRYRGEGKS